MNLQPEVRLSMAARPEGVGVVRQALAGMADALDFDTSILSDMKTAVTEACTNVVVHAYGDRGDTPEGPLEIDLSADAERLVVVVRDRGRGMPSSGTHSTAALGLGLPLIAALSDDYEVRGATTGGTEVRMSFLAARDHDPVEDDPIDEHAWLPPGASPDPQG